MLTITEGIVLKTQKYGEADLIVTYLTPSKGIIKAFAKSPRKTKSRFGSSMEPLTHAKISLWGKEQSMPKITQSDIINSRHHLRENLQDFIATSKLAEILISLTPEGIPNKKLFSFFLNSLNLIGSLITQNSCLSESPGATKLPGLAPRSGAGKTQNKDVLYLIFQIHLLGMLGYAAHLKGCGKCGAKSLNFYPGSGTVLCSKCAITPATDEKMPIKLTNSVINFYSHSIEWSLYISTRLKPHRDTVSRLSSLLDEHLNHLLGKRLLSSEFMAKV